MKPFNSMKNNQKLLSVFLASALAIGSVSISNAATLTYEGFTGYPTTNLVGQNGGSGWGGAWQSTSSDGFLHDVRTPTAIAYTGYTGSTTPAASGGNYLNLAAGFGGSNPTPVARQLDTSVGGIYATSGYLLSAGLIGADNTTLWGSFLYSNDDIGTGISTKTLTLSGGGTFALTLPQTSASNFMVFRINFGAGATDTVTSFSNPNLAIFNGTTGGVTSVLGNYSFNTFNLQEQGANFPGGSGTEGQFDDIRFGSTLGDVAPIPEPSSALLALVGLSSILMLRSRRI